MNYAWWQPMKTGYILVFFILIIVILSLPTSVAWAAGPLTCSWTGGGADSNWTTTLNWSCTDSGGPVAGVYPGKSDNATIDTLGGTVTLNADFSGGNSLASLTFRQGTIQGEAAGAHTLAADALVWSGGSLTNTISTRAVTLVSTNLSLAGASNVMTTSSFNLVVPQAAASAQWDGTSGLLILDSGVILTLGSGASFLSSFSAAGAGVVRWTGGDLANGAASGTVAPSFSNLEWRTGSGARFSANNLSFSIPQSVTASWNGTGTMSLGNGVSVTLNNGGTAAGTFTITGANGSVIWNGGDFLQNGGGSIQGVNLTISGASTRTINTVNISVSGAVNWNGSTTVHIDNGAAFSSTGSFTASISGNAGIDTTTTSTPGSFSYSGAFTKQGVGVFQVSLPFNNTAAGASLTINNGVLALAGGGTSNRTLTLTNPGIFRITNGSFNLNVALAGGSSGPIEVQGGTLTIGTAGVFTFPALVVSGGTLTGGVDFIVSGDLAWSGGTITTSANPQSLSLQTLTISSGGSMTLTHRQMSISGAVSWPAAAGTLTLNTSSITFSSNTIIGGNMAVQGNSELIFGGNGTVNGAISLGVSGAPLSLTNNGASAATLNGSISGSSGSELRFNGGNFEITGGFNHSGTLTSTGGTIQFTPSASLAGLGNSVILSGTTLDLSAGLPSSPLIVGSLSLTNSTLKGANPLQLTSLNWLSGTINGSGGLTAVTMDLNLSASSTIASFSGVSLTLPTGTTYASWDGTGLTLSSGSQMAISSGGSLNTNLGVLGNGSLAWLGGTMTNGANSGSVALSASNLSFINGSTAIFNASGTTLTLPHNITAGWDGTGQSLTLGNGATWRLPSGGAAAGAMTVTGGGTTEWAGGDLSGAGSVVVAALNYTGATDRNLAVNLVVSGAFGTSDSTTPGRISLTSGNLSLNGGGTLGWPITIGASRQLTFGGGNVTVNNQGSLGGAGQLVFALGTGNTANISGSCSISGGSTFSSGTVNFLNAASLSGLGGIVTISGATLDLSATLVPSPLAIANLALNAGTLQGSNPIAVSGSLSWQGGSLQTSGGLTAASLLLKSGPSTTVASFPGGHLDLSQSGATATWNGATLTLSSNASFKINNGGSLTGTLTINGGGSVQWDGGDLTGTGSLALARLNYTGANIRALDHITMTVSGTIQTTDSTTPGTLSLATSSLGLNGGGTLTWPVVVNTGSILTFGGGTFTLTSTSGLSGTGPVQFQLGSSGSAGVSCAFNLSGSTTFTSGTITFTTGATLTNLGNPVTINGATVIIQSSVTTSLTGTIDIPSGNLELLGGGTISQAVTVGSAGRLVFGGGTFDLNAHLDATSTGTFEVHAGTVNINTTVGTPFTFPNLAISGGVLTGPAGSDNIQVTSVLGWSGGTVRSVDVSASLTAGSLTVSGNGAMTLDTRLLSISGLTTWPNGTGALTLKTTTLTFNGGSIGGDLVIQGGNSLNLAGGMAINGGISLPSGTPAASLQLHNLGAVAVALNGAVSSAAGSILTFASGDFNLDGSLDASGGTKFLGGAIHFTPIFTLIRLGSPVSIQGTQLQIDVAIGANLNGAIQIQSGSLRLTGGGTLDRAIRVDAGGQLLFAGGAFTVNAAFDPAGSGTVGLQAGTVSIATNSGTPFTFPNLSVSGGGLTGAVGADNLSVPGSLNWTGGEISGPAGSSMAVANLNINAAQAITLTNRALTCSGATHWTGSGTLYLENALFTNPLGATFTVDSAGTALISGLTFPNSSSVINGGTLYINLPIGQATEINIPVQNSGAIHLLSGHLTINGVQPTTSSGPITVAQNSQLTFGFGNFDLQAGPQSSLSGAGTVEFAMGIGVATISAGYQLDGINGHTIFTSGETDFTPATVAPNFGGWVTIGNPATSSTAIASFSTGQLLNIPFLSINGGSLAGTDAVSAGILEWTSGIASQPIGSQPTTLAVQNALHMLGTDSKGLTGRSLVVNGPTTWSGPGTLVMSNGSNLINHGTMSVNPMNGGISVDSLLILADSEQENFQNLGAFVKQGSMRVLLNCQVVIGVAALINVQDGSLVFNNPFTMTGGILNVSSAATVQVNSPDKAFLLAGGILQGGGTVVANLTNIGGTIQPDGPPGFWINGTFVQSHGGKIHIDLVANSLLVVTPSASFGGVIQVARNGIIPAPGLYPIIRFFSRTGTFEAVGTMPPYPGLYLVPYYDDLNHMVSLMWSNQPLLGINQYLPFIRR